MNQNHIVDAVRTVGQLLLHRSTTEFMARDAEGRAVTPTHRNACKFCYMGAARAVAYKFRVPTRVMDSLCCTINGLIDGPRWDNASIPQQRHWARKLANYNG